jgi:predicted site-specific integrase-resolvase
MTTTPTDTAPLLVNAKEAARLLGISARLLWTLTNRGEVPCVRLGGAVRYRPETLQRIVARREGKPVEGGSR